ncbi:MAG: hypothetical protein GY807_23940 [Gammaproteobacteria bacterium]|nr:hypothetical protein [Gammaproteobacteria bacterium]
MLLINQAEDRLPLAPGGDVIHQAGSRLCYAPSAAGGTKSAPLTGEGHKFLVDAVCATQAQKRWARIPLSRKASNSDKTAQSHVLV